MRGRGEPSAVEPLEVVDEVAARRTRARSEFLAWVEEVGRTIADPGAMVFEFQVTHNAAWFALEREDLDAGIELARQLGSEPMSHPYRRTLAPATEFVRQNPRLANELAARFPSLDERDLDDLRARAAARAEPERAQA
jgi:hypothetical protein